MELLAPYVLSTHIKDMTVNPSFSPSDHQFFSGVPVGWGLIDNFKLAKILNKTGYDGFFAVEIDRPSPEWEELEDAAVGISVHGLRKIAESLN